MRYFSLMMSFVGLCLLLPVIGLSQTSDDANPGFAQRRDAADPERVVRDYLMARDPRTASTLLAPEYRMWREDHSGTATTKKDAAASMEWDMALRPYFYIRDLQVNGNQVVVRARKQNEFARLLGFPGWDFKSTFVVDDNGRIVSQLYLPSRNQPDLQEYLDKALPWLRENRPEALERIYPGGQIDRSADSAQEWVEVLRDWRASTGDEETEGVTEGETEGQRIEDRR